MVHSAGANGPHIKISADFVISCAACAPLVSPFPLARSASASLSSASDAVTEELPSFTGDEAYCALPNSQQTTGQSYLAKGSSDLSSSHHQQAVSTPEMDEQIEEAITTPILRQSSPNPAYDETTIAFGLPTKSSVECTLHNVLGHKVKTIAEGDFSSGWQRFTLIVKDLPPGVYLYRLNVNGKVLTKSLVIAQ